MQVRRIIVFGFAVLFAAVGIGFWALPEKAALGFHLEAVGVAGLATLRADLGGLFVGAALLCIAGAWTKRGALLMATAVILGAVVTGRLIALVANGVVEGFASNLAIEVAAIAALLACARGLEAPSASAPRRASRTALAAGVVVLIAVVTAAVLLNPGVQRWMFERAAARATANVNSAPLADDALRVAIAGSSAPLTSLRRANACVAVFAGGRFYVVDAGPSSVENLSASGIPMSQIGGVFLTHYHSDHIGELGELNLQTWANGRPAPLPVYGGPGIEQVVDGFNEAYRLDQGYRTAHHTAQVMVPENWPLVAHRVELEGPPAAEKSRSALVLDDGTLRVTAFEVDHTPIAPAYAYRFDYKGRSVLITGDTKFHPPLTQAAKGADVMVSEAIARPMVEALQRGSTAANRERAAHIMHDIQDYHISPQEAARIANDAGVKLLVFYHLLPAPDGFLPRSVFGQGVNEVRKGDWVIADDGSLYTLPIGSSEVRIGRLGS